MLHVALYEPEIPPNTGNIIRLCANAGATLHLIHPLGFAWDDKQLRRAQLDYSEWVNVRQHPNFARFQAAQPELRLIACTTHATQRHTDIRYRENDCLLLGKESRGLPQAIRDSLPVDQRVRIPMRPESRSLNLSNACAIILYEAWRQLEFK
jgi:tRNA (cytidine/uridine-2'-O-)-methyltransferase